MDPELKTHLKGMESRLKSDIADVLEVVRDVGANVSKSIDKIENDYSDLRQRIDFTAKRTDFLEKKILNR